MSDFVFCVLILMIAIPVTAYLTTKLARFAYLKATQLFNETSNLKSGDDDNGNPT